MRYGNEKELIFTQWDIEQHLRSALAAATPDIWKKLDLTVPQEKAERSAVSSEEQGQIIVLQKCRDDGKTEKEKRKVAFTRRFLRWGVAVAAGICLIISGSVYHYEYLQVVSQVEIDVNPSLMLSLNRHQQVLKAAALNQDGAELMDSSSLKGCQVEEAVEQVVNSLVEKGYLGQDGQEYAVLVSVSGKDKEKTDQLKSEISWGMENALSERDVSAVVYDQTIEVTKELEELAEAYQVSVGKAEFVDQLVSANVGLNQDEQDSYARLMGQTMEKLTQEIGQNEYQIGSSVTVIRTEPKNSGTGTGKADKESHEGTKLAQSQDLEEESSSDRLSADEKKDFSDSVPDGTSEPEKELEEDSELKSRKGQELKTESERKAETKPEMEPEVKAESEPGKDQGEETRTDSEVRHTKETAAEQIKITESEPESEGEHSEEGIEIKESETEETKTEESETETSEAETSEAETSEAEESDAERLKINESEAETSKVKESEAETSKAKESEAETSKAKESETEETAESESVKEETGESDSVREESNLPDSSNEETEENSRRDSAGKQSDMTESKAEESSVEETSQAGTEEVKSKEGEIRQEETQEKTQTEADFSEKGEDDSKDQPEVYRHISKEVLRDWPEPPKEEEDHTKDENGDAEDDEGEEERIIGPGDMINHRESGIVTVTSNGTQIIFEEQEKKEEKKAEPPVYASAFMDIYERLLLRKGPGIFSDDASEEVKQEVIHFGPGFASYSDGSGILLEEEDDSENGILEIKLRSPKGRIYKIRTR